MLSPIVIVGAGSTTASSLVPMMLQESSAPLHLITGSDLQLDHENVRVTRVDVTKRSELKNAILSQLPSTIINLAGHTNVDACESEKRLAWKLNVSLLENLIRIARSADAHILHVSTDYVFDGEKGPYDESDIPSPINYYGKSKLAGENALAASGVDYTIVRTNVVYSPNPSRPDFVHFVLNSFEKGLGIRAATDQFGNPTYVDDLAEAIMLLATRRLTGLYHVGGSEYVSRYEFARQIARTFRLDEAMISPVLSADLQQAARRPLRAGLVSLKAESQLRTRFRGVESGLISYRHSLFAKAKE